MSLRVDYLTHSEVDSPEKLARYIQQTVGTPFPDVKDINQLKKKVKAFFKQYPHLNYTVLCAVADWCARKKRRFARTAYVVDMFRYAYADGALKCELTQEKHDPFVEEAIEKALKVETDERWQRRLIIPSSARMRREVIDEWDMVRKPLLVT